MRMNRIGATLALLGLGACASTGTRHGGGAATCQAEAAKALVGQAAPDDRQILRRTGGSIVRRIAPGDMTTKDYRIERVTVTVADGQVVEAYCG
ncbi:I78 family peptidase inhibitor [Sphingomonas sp.]|uniref:I78 family peptidase inhibitor n=1 Tax=Sphingomonas sp. TaxID=28214 RepID=UPI003B3A81A9